MAASAEGLEPTLRSRLEALIAASGGRVWIVSGYRSVEEQQALWDEALAKYGSEDAARQWVAPPGKSRHNTGRAVDIGGDLDLAARLAPQFGLYNPMSWEPWHFELTEEPVDQQAQTTPPAAPATANGQPVEQRDPMAMLLRMLGVSTDIFAGSRAGGQTTAFDDALRDFASGRPQPAQPPTAVAAASGAPPGDQPVGEFEDWVREIQRIKGLSDEEANALRIMAQYESGGRNIGQEIHDVNTEQGNPAFGPWQVIEPTFRTYAEPGYTDWRNPVHNGLAAYNYAIANYGSVQAVADRFQRTGRGGY